MERFCTVAAVALVSLFLHAQSLAAVEIDAAKYLDKNASDCGFQKAIDAVAEQGGGTVKLPEGIFKLRAGLVLRDKVALVGAGMDKTILTPARKPARVSAAQNGPDKDGRIVLNDLPAELKVGTAVIGSSSLPAGWYGAPKPGAITAIDATAKAVTVEWPYGSDKLTAGKGTLTYGLVASLAQDVKKDDTEITLKDASLFRPGDELAIGQPGNESMIVHHWVKEVKGNTLVLTAPARINFAAQKSKEEVGNVKYNSLIWALFPLIHGAHVKDAAIRDLTVRGYDPNGAGFNHGRYPFAGIHIFDAVRLRIERIAIRGWTNTDALSLQTGENCYVADSEFTDNGGNGMHPGTALKNSVFERNLSTRNGVGVYFCWHNNGHVFRNNKIIANRGGGMTGLGNPGERNNTIEDNLIADNGGPGIEVNGGIVSKNVIRNNIIRDNSRAKPGQWPGILLHAAQEDARAYTVEGNTIESTTTPPTQTVGVEERNGKYRDKPTVADDNIIRNNKFAGHTKADIMVVGAKTLVENNGQASIVRGAAATQPVATSAAK